MEPFQNGLVLVDVATLTSQDNKQKYSTLCIIICSVQTKMDQPYKASVKEVSLGGGWHGGGW